MEEDLPDPVLCGILQHLPQVEVTGPLLILEIRRKDLSTVVVIIQVENQEVLKKKKRSERNEEGIDFIYTAIECV